MFRAELDAQNAALSGTADALDGGPVVDPARLGVVDEAGRCCGHLHKKGGSKSAFLNRHNWTMRLFWIRLDLGATENYELSYHKGSPDFDALGEAAVRKTAKGALGLAGCTVVEASTEHASREVGFEFQLCGAREAAFEMYAETEAELRAWAETIRYAIRGPSRAPSAAPLLS